MTAVLGPWRASYAPGEWLVLAGPTSLVMVDSPALDDPSLISTLWDQVVSSSSMTDLAARLAGYRIDTLPSLAAFFWTDNGMRSLVRGKVSVLEVPSGRVLAQGEGIQTWTEVGLGEIRRVLVEPDSGGDDNGAEMPLIIGAVRASSVLLDSTEEARVSSPQGQLEPLLDADRGSEAATPDPVEPAEGPAEPEVPVEGLATEQMEDPFGDAERSTARVEPEPPPALDSEVQAQMENADTQLMTSAFPPPDPTPPPTDGSQDSLIMAVVCPYGHPSPQNATSCRVCGSPIAPQGPRLLPRPVLAVLRASDGSTAAVDRAVLVGRAPSAQRSSSRAPRLLTVPSPGHDISRTHVEIAPDGWQIAVTDLNSTNGTVLVRPEGVDRQQLAPGETVVVQLGTVVELGDDISVLIDFPQ
ncbi:MAG TPA: FHA domain-containing protein [Propionibacteriaceae bacterium]|nr:FHA domain-containing protein [Propionibacteriaceae bacterium]